MGSTESTGTAGGEITTPGVLSERFTEFISTDNVFVCVHLYQEGLALSKNNLQSKKCPAYYFIEWREELANVPLATCIQIASIHSDPLQLNPTVLNKKLCVLNFMSVDHTNLAYNKMLLSDCTAQLEEQYNERSEDRIAKTKNLFIDGKCLQSKHALNCIANMIMFIDWIYVNGRDTFWCKQLLGILIYLSRMQVDSGWTTLYPPIHTLHSISL